MNSVTIITALHGRLELTRGFHKSLENNPPSIPWDIIWIDDASPDDTRKWLKSFVHSGHAIFNDTNRGFAASNNLGARQASGDLLLFLNNDLVLRENWFDPLLAEIREHKDVAVVGNCQINLSGRLDHAGVCFDMLGLPDHLYKNRNKSVLSASSGQFVRALTGACCLIRRELFSSVGGFDERYRNGCEDVDLCLRLGEMGYRHWVDYRSVVWHHVSSSPGRKDYEERNLGLFLQRWGHLTSKWGQEDWPRNYLSKHLRCPWKLNGTKTVDALLRLAGLKHGDSKWAAKRREGILARAPKSV